MELKAAIPTSGGWVENTSRTLSAVMAASPVGLHPAIPFRTADTTMGVTASSTATRYGHFRRLGGGG